MASREILLRFATTNLKKAAQTVKAIRKETREAIRGIKDVGERRRARAEARSQEIEDRELLNDARARQRGDARSRRVRRRSRASALAGGRGVSGSELVENVRTSLGGGTLGVIGVAAQRSGPIAVVASVIWDALGRPYVEARLRALESELVDSFTARLERIEADSFATRLREDVLTQERVGLQGARSNRAIQDAIRSKRVVPTDRISRLVSGA